MVRAPTAVGKSAIGVTVARYASAKLKLKSHTIVPTKQLVDQLLMAFPRMVSLKARADYPCDRPEVTEGPRGGITEEPCGECPNCKQRLSDNRKIRMVPYGVSNYYVAYSYKVYKPLLIVDEGHRLLEVIRDMGAVRFSRREYEFPADLGTYGEILGWAEHELQAGRGNGKLEMLVSQLRSLKMSTTLHITREPYRGRMDTVLKLLPIDIRHLPPWFWPSKVKKIVLMSATIGPQDIADMGLANRKVAYIDCDSPIPAMNRPVFYTPVADMRMAAQETSVPEVVKRVGLLAQKFQGKKGLIHATYRVSAALQASALSSNPRFIWHTAANRKAAFEEFQASEDGILVACGMHKGIDLPYDACRWQVITQVPWPSLDDPAVAVRLKADPVWYAYQAAKSIMQAAGRVCRTPEDYGCSYIIDTQWERLERYGRANNLFPQWFLDAII